MSRLHFALSLLALGLTACGADADVDVDLDEQPDQSVDELRSNATRPAREYNFAGQGHNDQCVRPRAGLRELTLYYADATPSGYTIPVSALQHRPDQICPDGTIQLDVREAIETRLGTMYFHRGGYGYVNAGNVKYGWLRLGELGERPTVRASNAGNGARCEFGAPGSSERTLQVHPRSIPPEMNYWKSDRSGTISYRGYGNPGRDQGSLPVLHDYTYLVWSWMNVPGGGVVRTTMHEGDVFHRCNVRSIRLNSVSDDGRVNGWVQSVYGGVRQGDRWFFGWATYAHQRNGDAAPTYHLSPM